MNIKLNRVIRFTIALLVFASANIANAQKGDGGPVGIFDSREEYSQFMGGLKSLRDPEINAMLPAINDMALGRPIGQTAQQYNIGGDSPVMSMLANDEIRKDLEIVDTQMDSLSQVNEEFQKRVASEMRSVDLSNASEVLSRMRGLTEAAKTEMEGVFLPHQLERLRQLGVQRQMSRKGVLGALLTDPIASILEISDKQKKELRDSAEEIEQELAKEMEALRAKARKKLFSKLNPEQQKELNEMIGDDFQFGKSSTGIVAGSAPQRSKGKQKKGAKGDYPQKGEK